MSIVFDDQRKAEELDDYLMRARAAAKDDPNRPMDEGLRAAVTVVFEDMWRRLEGVHNDRDAVKARVYDHLHPTLELPELPALPVGTAVPADAHAFEPSEHPWRKEAFFPASGSIHIVDADGNGVCVVQGDNKGVHQTFGNADLIEQAVPLFISLRKLRREARAALRLLQNAEVRAAVRAEDLDYARDMEQVAERLERRLRIITGVLCNATGGRLTAEALDDGEA